MLFGKVVSRFSAVALVFSAAGITQAQQPPAGAPNAGPKSTIMVVTENPGLRLLDKKDGTALTDVNFWRVTWSPVGVGTVCFITVRGEGDMNFRVAITDNERLANHIMKDLMGGLSDRFKNPYAIEKGTVVQTNTATDRTETCKSDQRTVAITWKDLGTPNWVPVFRPPGNQKIVQTFVMVIASGAAVTVNGKQAPGTYFPTGGGFGPGAYLALNETWRLEE